MNSEDKFVRIFVFALTIILILSGIVIITSTNVTAQLSDPSSMQPHAPIQILDDTDFTTANGVRSGDGSAADPFVIANWTVDCNDTSTGIEIRGTTQNFIIRNCRIVNGTDCRGIFIYGRNVGGQMTTSDFVIENVEINETKTAIDIEGWTDYSMPSDFSIRNSTFTNGTGIALHYGIFINVSYIDEKWSIDNCSFYSSEDDAIKIESVYKYFSVTNCTFDKGDWESFISLDQQGIAQSLRPDFLIKNHVMTNGISGILIGSASNGGNVSDIDMDNMDGFGISVAGLNTRHVFIKDVYMNDTSSISYPYAITTQGVTTTWVYLENVVTENCYGGFYFNNDNYATIKNCKVLNLTSIGPTEPVGLYIQADDSVVENNEFVGESAGIYTDMGSNNRISNNTITDTHNAGSKSGCGIYMLKSDTIEVVNNTITNSSFGIRVDGNGGDNALDNVFYDNWITDSEVGVFFNDFVADALFYNNFVYDNDENVTDEDTTAPAENLWSETYANGGGNYWGNYTGPDTMSGALQDQPGADGFGDTPYQTGDIIYDEYPIMRLPDYTPPTSVMTSLNNWYNKSFDVFYDAYDNSWLRSIALQFDYSIDNTSFAGYVIYETRSITGTTSAGSFTFVPPNGDGYYRLRLNATDFVMLEEDNLPLYDSLVGYDTVKPTSNADMLPATSDFNNFNVSYQMNDATSGVYQVELYQANSTNGTIYDPYFLAGTMTAPNLDDFLFIGNREVYYRFYTRALDFIGNYEDEPVTNDTGIYINKTIVLNYAPTTTLTLGAPNYGTDPTWVTTSTPINLSAMDSTFLVDFIWYSLDGGTNHMVYTTEFMVPAGTTHILFGAQDELGLNETAKRVNISIDDDAPVSTLTIGTPKSGTNPVIIDETTEFNLSAVDAGVGLDSVFYNIDNTTWKTFTGTNFTITGYGAHVLEYYASDLLANDEAVTTLNLSIPQPPPVKPKVTGTVTFSGGPQDSLGAENVSVELFQNLMDFKAGNWSENKTLIDETTTNVTYAYSFEVDAGINYSVKVTPKAADLANETTSGYEIFETNLFDVTTLNVNQNVALVYFTYTPPPPPTLTLTAPVAQAQYYTGDTVTISGGSTELVNGIIVTLTLGNATVDVTIAAYGKWSGELSAPDTAGNYTITATSGTLTDSVSIEVIDLPGDDKDTDDDGLNDDWEMLHFSSLDYDGSDDPDGDTFNNEREYNAGTNPMDPDSYPTDTDDDEDDTDDKDYTITIIIIVVLVALLLISIFAFLILKKKQKDEEEEEKESIYEQPEDEMECPTCGSVFAVGHTNCPECGEELEVVEEE